ncbi:MAG: UDP-N-acetylmuramoyl-tripeptide--D-alanyl-D-alanine ligase [Spirochaetales bacterium]|nr:UDP-N-acetylmuramoyl-tripeptide--D-alanyl-D-alanine ligase [Spirochaetales bacterium]
MNQEKQADKTVLLTLEEIHKAARGRVLCEFGSNEILGFEYDSRKCKEGCCFLALPGENTDGHRFLESAFQKGAVLGLVSMLYAQDHEAELLRLGENYRCSIVVVDDVLMALHDCARYYLAKFPDLVKIGITGSNGKTTTKEIIASILSTEAPTVMTPGNYNSEIGLPLSIFLIREEHRYAVFEMGMNHPGEMDLLADTLKPDLAVITNIGTAHIGFMGTQDNIAAEKKKIFKHFKGRQRAYICEDEPYLSFLSENVQGEIVFFGQKTSRGVTQVKDLGLDGYAVDWEDLQVLFPLLGRYNLNNALAGLTLAMDLGYKKENIKKGLEQFKPLFGRSQIERGKITLLVDCYNANLDSVKKVLSFVSSLVWDGQKILVLGSMFELGEKSHLIHQELGEELAGTSHDRLFLFGKEMESAFRSFMALAPDAHIYFTHDYQDLEKQILAILEPGDFVLLKGSRGVALERLVPALKLYESRGPLCSTNSCTH